MDMDVEENIHLKAKSMLTNMLKYDFTIDPEHTKKVTEDVLDLYKAHSEAITIDVLVLISAIRAELRMFTSVLD